MPATGGDGDTVRALSRGAAVPERTPILDVGLGELSPFHDQYSFYVQGIDRKTIVLTPGWEGRCRKISNANTRNYAGLCLEAHDLALSKLAAWRPKDKRFVRVLLREELVTERALLRRLKKLPVKTGLRETIHYWIKSIAAELRRKDIRS